MTIDKNNNGKDLNLAAISGDLLKVTELIKVGAKIETELNDNTPIIYAVANNHTEIAKELIKNGANVNKISDLGETALILATKHGNLTLVKELIQAGADVNFKNKSSTNPLLIAATLGKEEIVKELIQAGADVNVSNNIGVTPLMIATHNQYPTIANMLVAAMGRSLENNSNFLIKKEPNIQTLDSEKQSNSISKIVGESEKMDYTKPVGSIKDLKTIIDRIGDYKKTGISETPINIIPRKP